MTRKPGKRAKDSQVWAKPGSPGLPIPPQTIIRRREGAQVVRRPRESVCPSAEGCGFESCSGSTLDGTVNQNSSICKSLKISGSGGCQIWLRYLKNTPRHAKMPESHAGGLKSCQPQKRRIEPIFWAAKAPISNWPALPERIRPANPCAGFVGGLAEGRMWGSGGSRGPVRQPLVRQQLGEPLLWVSADPPERVSQICERIDPVPLSRGDEARQHRGCTSAIVASQERPVPAAHRHAAQTPLGAVVVDLQQLSHRAEQHPLQGGQVVRQVFGSKCHRPSTALSADTSNLLHLLARFKTKHALPLLFWRFRLRARLAHRLGRRIPLAPPPFAQIHPQWRAHQLSKRSFADR